MPTVLHVVSYFPPDRIGGVGEVVAHIHRALLQSGHRSMVLTTGVSTDDVSVRRIARSPAGFGLSVLRSASLARDADVVHIHHGEGLGLLLAMRAQRIHTPVLLTLHVSVAALRRSSCPYRVAGRAYNRDSPSRWIHRELTMRVRSALDGMAMRLADRVNFISRSAAVDVLGPAAGALATVVYNGVPTAPVDVHSDATPSDLLFVGANTARKRVELLPLILAAVRRRRPDARLRIVGIVPDENPELVSVARELGVADAIDFTGRVPPGTLSRYYRSAKVLLVPSAYEGLPMVILEAMQYGLPVVATRVSGHPEVIEEGINGLLVPLDDPAAMADAAVLLLDDPELRSRCSAAGPAAIRDRFSVERQARAYIAEYEVLVRNQAHES